MYFPIIDVLKENFIAKIPSIVTQWLTDNVDPVGSAVVVDESLSISGAAADAKITGDEINDLKSDLSETVTSTATPINETYSNINSSGKLVAVNQSDNMRMYYATVEAGKTYTVIQHKSDDLYCGFFNTVNPPQVGDVSYNGQRSVVTGGNTITAPISGYICFRSLPTKTDEEIYYITAVDKDARLDIDNIEESITGLDTRLDTAEDTLEDDILYTVSNATKERIDVTGVTGTLGFVEANGTVHSNSTYFYTSKISVQAGDMVIPYVNNYTQERPIRFVCAYVGETVDASKGSNTENSGYTVPDGVTAVVLTCYASNMANMQYYIDRTYPNDITDQYHDKNKWSLKVEAQSVSSGETIKISEASEIFNKKNCSYDFWCNLESIDTLEVGHGKNVLASSYIKIDDTYLYAYEYNVEKGKYSHGLTIDDFIGININVSNTAVTTAKVTIVTAGGARFVQDNVPFAGCIGDVFAKPTMAITNAVLSYSMRDLKTDVFIFGDSYISLNDINRWPYHAIDAGYTDYMLIGYPGAGSAGILNAFRAVMNLARPKVVVWAVGMNNADEASTYNAVWKSALDNVMAFCETAHITLILATIPNTPEVSNVYKNQYVRESGYRYIDFAKAVGAEAINSSWYSGMLSTDNVHPTVLGARSLAMRLLVDLPEIT